MDTVMRVPHTKLPSKGKAGRLREWTYERLKSKVLSGGFNPGERLTEEHLADELGVSRTPVREALHKLELEGLIEPLATRGLRVTRDTKEEMEELFEIRSVLEGYALRCVSEEISEEPLQQLQSFIDKADKAYGRKRIEEVFRWNTKFHDTLNDMIAHKPRFHQLIVDMRKYVLRYRKDTLHYLEGARRSIDGHRKVMLALRLRDPDLCERIMREHVHEAKEDALQAVAERT